MQIVTAIIAFFKIVMFMLNLWKEKDEAKAQKKAEVANEIVDALKTTDRRDRASRINIALGHIKRV